MNTWMPWSAMAWGNLTTPASPASTVSGTRPSRSVICSHSSIIQAPSPSPVMTSAIPASTARRVGRSEGLWRIDQRNSAASPSEKTPMETAISTKTALSSGVKMLKWEGTPRHVCTVIKATSMRPEPISVIARARSKLRRSGRRSIIQPQVQRRSPTDIPKVTGLRNETAPPQPWPSTTSTTEWTRAESPRTRAAVPSRRLDGLVRRSCERRLVMRCFLFGVRQRMDRQRRCRHPRSATTGHPGG